LAALRRKLEPVPSQPRYFITEPGMGYRFVLSTSGTAKNP
jgi:two-component system KDP operon response regulator KdpE